MKSIVTYSSKVWRIKETTKRKLKATEIYFLRRAAGKFRRRDIIDDIISKQLIWYGHVQRCQNTESQRKYQTGTLKETENEEDHAEASGDGVDKEMQKTDLWMNREAWQTHKQQSTKKN